MPVDLFALASQHNAWLSQRQVAVASNVANVDSPGYRARDVEPFAEVVARAGRELDTTHAGHMQAPPPAPRETAEVDGDERAKHSGNTVSVEAELIKMQDVRRAYSLNAAIIKAFHGMTITASKG